MEPAQVTILLCPAVTSNKESITNMSSKDQERTLLEEARIYARQLEQVNAIGRELSSMLELEPLLQRILRAALELTNTEEGAFFLVEEPDNHLVFSVVDGGPEGLTGMRLPPGTGIVGQVAMTGEPQMVNDVQLNPYWSDTVDKASDHKTRSILAVPLKRKEKCIGVLEVINRTDGQPFHQQDLVGLTALSLQAVVAMETARLHQAELTKQRMERELQLGYTMQAGLIPTEMPVFLDWEFAAWWKPAREVGGDFYDFMFLDDDLGLIIADVADKGVQAALFMALTRSTVRSSLLALHQPAMSISNANKIIADDAQDGMFVTLFYAQFRPGTGEVVYVNAGHNSPILYRKSHQDIVGGYYRFLYRWNY